MIQISKRSLITLLVIYVIFVGGYGVHHMFLPEKAVSANDRTLKKQNKHKELMEEANTQVAMGNPEEAVEYFEEAEKIAPKDRKTLYQLASSQHNAKKYEEAEETLEKLEDSEKESADYWAFRATNMSYILTSEKNINLAVKYAEKADELAIYHDSWVSVENTARIYLEQYKYYRLNRQYSTHVSEKEIAAQNKFLEKLKKLTELGEKDSGSPALRSYNELLEEYNSLSGVKLQKEIKELPELQPIEDASVDFEQIKKMELPKK